MDNQLTCELNAQLKLLDDEILDLKSELEFLMRQQSEIKKRMEDGKAFKDKLQRFRLINSESIKPRGLNF